MKKFLYLVFLVSLISALISCGGSNGDSPFAGEWSGTLFLVETVPEGCATQESIDVEYTVLLDGSTLTVEDPTGPTLTGEIDSDTSFEADFFVGSGFSPTSFSLEFSEVLDGIATATFTDSQGSFTFENGLNSCLKRWQGEVVRQ